jgi:hydrogenase maturation protein HypF
MLARGVNAPVTSSAGRLFDAVASLCGLRQRLRHEGQAAMDLEHCLQSGQGDGYPMAVGADGDGPAVVDWGPMVAALLADLAAGTPVGQVSRRFHDGLVEAIVAVSRRVGAERVVLTGGCMQNRYLAERAVERLREAGLRPYWHQRVPPNDGGIALGQAAAVRSRLTGRAPSVQ